jgi:ClpP class serine protease
MIFCARTSKRRLDDPAVKAIMPVIDSPGGEVNGADELAQAIL